jgi:hypothetical protein
VLIKLCDVHTKVEKDDIHGEDGIGNKLINCSTLEEKERSKPKAKVYKIGVCFWQPICNIVYGQV